MSSSHTRSPLLDLPPEIRNKIYSACFEDDYRILVNPWLTGTRNYPPVPPLLLLSKQIHNEALALRQTQTTIEIRCDSRNLWNLDHEMFIGYAAKKAARAERMLANFSGYRVFRLDVSWPWHSYGREAGAVKWRTAMTRLLTSLAPGGSLATRSGSLPKRLTVFLCWSGDRMSCYSIAEATKYALCLWLSCSNVTLSFASFDGAQRSVHTS